MAEYAVTDTSLKPIPALINNLARGAKVETLKDCSLGSMSDLDQDEEKDMQEALLLSLGVDLALMKILLVMCLPTNINKGP